MICLWSYSYSVTLEHDLPVSRRTSPSLQRMNRLVIGHDHHRVAVWSARDDPLVGVGLLNDAAVIHYWTLPHQTNSGGDGHLLHQRRVVRRWWQNNQWPLHPMVTELHMIFTIYLLIQLGLNNLLNTHHIDIIITHHSSCPQWRVLVIITMLDTSCNIPGFRATKNTSFLNFFLQLCEACSIFVEPESNSLTRHCIHVELVAGVCSCSWVGFVLSCGVRSTQVHSNLLSNSLWIHLWVSWKSTSQSIHESSLW
jgi:hypothetical protein